MPILSKRIILVNNKDRASTNDEALSVQECLPQFPENNRIKQLERDLHDTKDQLKSLIDMYEAVVSGLKSTNTMLYNKVGDLNRVNVQSETHHQLLIAELNHRVRNMLQVVSGLAAQTLKHSPTLEAFSTSFLGRIHALARAYELLSREAWGDIRLSDLIRNELKPHAGDEGRYDLSGPVIMLKPRGAMTFSLILHELSTNALKYGALSEGDGHVIVNWTIKPESGQLTVEWKENGAPKQSCLVEKGFGSELIARQVEYELSGQFNFSFTSSGFCAIIVVPIDSHLFSLAEDAHEPGL